MDSAGILVRHADSLPDITVVIAIVVLLGNLLVDLMYGLLDPRIRYD